MIEIWVKQREPHLLVIFTARNELTEDTALGFIHLLRHLSAEAGAALLSVKQNSDIDWEGLARRPSSPGMDGSVGCTFPRLRCQVLDIGRGELAHITQIFRHVGRLFSHCQQIRAGVYETLGESDIEMALEASSTEMTVGELELRQCALAESPAGRIIDHTVGYLRHKAVGLERFPRRVRVLLIDDSSWPGTCPREEGVMVPSGNGEVRAYSFGNEPSGGEKEFRLQIFTSNSAPSFDQMPTNAILLLF